jgi:predicted nuclease of predicted toxin-antitoxin system
VIRFKIDENLPVEAAELLRAVGYDALTVSEQKMSGKKDSFIADICRKEKRTLVTLDLDFSDERYFKPVDSPGIIILRVRKQDKVHLLELIKKLIHMIPQEPLLDRIWIVEETRIRIRGGKE